MLPLLRSRGRRRAAVAVVLALLGLGAWRWLRGDDEEEKAVQTARVERGTLTLSAASSGTVDADGRVDVKSEASGEVSEILVEEGDTVAAGALLARIDPTDAERKVQDARATYQSARSRLALAEASLSAARGDSIEAGGRYDRRKQAYAAGAVSGEALQEARTAYSRSVESVRQREAEIASAEAELARAGLSVEDAERRLSKTSIRAPSAGTVLSVNVERGSMVSSGITNVGGGTALLSIADPSRLFVNVKLDEAQIGSVKPGQEATIRVDAYPERTFRGVVDRIAPLGVAEANIVTFDVKVRIVDRAARLLRVGMSADVEIETERHEGVLLVPAAAVRRDTAAGGAADRGGSRPGRGDAADGDTAGRAAHAGRRPRGETDPEEPPHARRRRAAYVLLPDGARRPVEIGATNGLQTVVDSGLAEGDTVVVAGLDEGQGPQARSSIFSMGRPGGGRSNRR